MHVQKIASFSNGEEGGNPAGVVLLETMASDAEMARVAAEVGYSETVFAVALDDTRRNWRVRYFSPEAEVPFCGHATIALGAVLGRTIGAGKFDLTLNEASISVDATVTDEGIIASLASPPTRSEPAKGDECKDVLSLFGLTEADLDPRLPPARIHGGADHFVVVLKGRDRLAQMRYDFEMGQEVMRRHGFVTVMLVFIEANQTFIVRNAFAFGGVVEDPATGAAAAAFAGYLRDQGWPHRGAFTIRQGEDIGSPSLIEVELSDVSGSSVQVSGRARIIE